MTEATRRERLRADTEQHIRRQARALLVGHGRDAVTLRAIAREVGITAPALYRYYDSREDLLRQLCDDICTDLSAELNAIIAACGDTVVSDQVFAVCRGFRRWALAHPQEFTLVFASTEDTIGAHAPRERPDVVGDQFGRVFLQLAGRLIAGHPAPDPPTGTDVPESLHDDLAAFQKVLITAVNEHGAEVTPDVLGEEAIFHVVQCWVRLYGHVALEVFGRFPFAVSDPGAMFDSMIRRMIGEIGFQP
ncbi:TetR/AcrR family transcriptional regulator [Umezawaea beigongshangensis]|uniref:TetR/AcrR family transcriptional regulator n=1 Tax=Umezawaea beigongshangensis TaxID=2780383 RepID=UPI0018F15C4C|nr:TetR/AcrR family transcriptional regulator [Umezawaea beigongshangensis]